MDDQFPQIDPKHLARQQATLMFEIKPQIEKVAVDIGSAGIPTHVIISHIPTTGKLASAKLISEISIVAGINELNGIDFDSAEHVHLRFRSYGVNNNFGHSQFLMQWSFDQNLNCPHLDEIPDIVESFRKRVMDEV